jgi:hypothetical protein
MKQLVKPWIFVSHSTKDIVKVRDVRNDLENHNCEPLLFRMKFLENSAYAKFLRPLLEVEMEARQFFLYCRSKNSRASFWVQQEIIFINKQPNKLKYWIDIDRMVLTSAAYTTPVRRLIRRASIVLLFHSSLHQQAQDISSRLTGDRLSVGDIKSLRENFDLDHGIWAVDARDDNWSPDAEGWVGADTAIAVVDGESSQRWSEAPATRRATMECERRYVVLLEDIEPPPYRPGIFMEPQDLPGWRAFTGNVDQQLAQIADDIRRHNHSEPFPVEQDLR